MKLLKRTYSIWILSFFIFQRGVLLIRDSEYFSVQFSEYNKDHGKCFDVRELMEYLPSYKPFKTSIFSFFKKFKKNPHNSSRHMAIDLLKKIKSEIPADYQKTVSNETTLSNSNESEKIESTQKFKDLDDLINNLNEEKLKYYNEYLKPKNIKEIKDSQVIKNELSKKESENLAQTKKFNSIKIKLEKIEKDNKKLLDSKVEIEKDLEKKFTQIKSLANDKSFITFLTTLKTKFEKLETKMSEINSFYKTQDNSNFLEYLVDTFLIGKKELDYYNQINMYYFLSVQLSQSIKKLEALQLVISSKDTSNNVFIQSEDDLDEDSNDTLEYLMKDTYQRNPHLKRKRRNAIFYNDEANKDAFEALKNSFESKKNNPKKYFTSIKDKIIEKDETDSIEIENLESQSKESKNDSEKKSIISSSEDNQSDESDSIKSEEKQDIFDTALDDLKYKIGNKKDLNKKILDGNLKELDEKYKEYEKKIGKFEETKTKIKTIIDDSIQSLEKLFKKEIEMIKNKITKNEVYKNYHDKIEGAIELIKKLRKKEQKIMDNMRIIEKFETKLGKIGNIDEKKIDFAIPKDTSDNLRMKINNISEILPFVSSSTNKDTDSKEKKEEIDLDQILQTRKILNEDMKLFGNNEILTVNALTSILMSLQAKLNLVKSINQKEIIIDKMLGKEFAELQKMKNGFSCFTRSGLSFHIFTMIKTNIIINETEFFESFLISLNKKQRDEFIIFNY